MKRKLLLIMAILAVVAIGAFSWIFFSATSNPHNYAKVGDIPAPAGYHRVKGEDSAYAKYLRALPLKKRGSKVRLYLGGLAIPQSVNYAVVDMPLLSNAEQCADVCMRLRAEYLYKAGKPIKFQDVHGNTRHYEGGASRKEFEKYLRSLYQVASTFSMCREMKTRPLADMQPGDVFVFPARNRHSLGHAMMVVDVAVNKRGEKVYMLAEGSTPARSIHIVWDVQSVWRTPWFTLDETSKRIFASVCFYKPSDLRHF